MASRRAVLEVDDLKVYYATPQGDVRACDGVTFTLYEGETLGLVGESGSGKSTLANLVLGFDKPTHGTIRFEGRDVGAMGSRDMKGYHREVQAVFQDPFGSYNPFYRVGHVFDMVIRNYKLAKRPSDAREQVEEGLNAVGLTGDDVLRKYPHQLSGGQRQRIMMARAYLLKPKLIVADEPVSMVDASLRASILDVMMKLRDEDGISFLYVTHDLSTAYQIGDRIVLFYQGTLAESGRATEVITAPKHPLRAAARRLGAEGRPRAALAGRGDAARRGGAAHRGLHRLPFPPALPRTHAALPRSAAAAVPGGRGGARGVVLPVRRRRLWRVPTRRGGGCGRRLSALGSCRRSASVPRFRPCVQGELSRLRRWSYSGRDSTRHRCRPIRLAGTHQVGHAVDVVHVDRAEVVDVHVGPGVRKGSGWRRPAPARRASRARMREAGAGGKRGAGAPPGPRAAPGPYHRCMDTSPTVDSPCIGVCAIDEAAGHCAGCARTIDEIVGWGRADVATKRAVLAAAGERRRARDAAIADASARGPGSSGDPEQRR